MNTLSLDNTHTSASSNITSTFHDNSRDKLRRRLLHAGIHNFRFISDNDHDPESEVPVKTLIWEGSYQSPPTTKTAASQHHFFFATATRATDRVNISSLKRHIDLYSGRVQGQAGAGVEVRLAERDEAEKRTGYGTGTIPPIGHDSIMDLYLDHQVLNGDGDNRKNENHDNKKGGVGDGDEIGKVTGPGCKEGMENVEFTPHAVDNERARWLSIGSGSNGTSLLLSPSDLLRMARYPDQEGGGGVARNVFLCCLSSSAALSPAKTTATETTKTIVSETTKTTATKVVDGRKVLSKRLRDAAGRAGRSDEVRRIIEEMGDNFASHIRVGSEGNRTKNALHLAAWKGDITSLRLLLNAASKNSDFLHPTQRPVDTISIGEGNYGKTPIFYAITQSRSDVATLLITEYSANLLIVNNKGQTPSSLAESHLNEEARRILRTWEAKQLREGGTFTNYRQSRSDGRRYGDLDPRFDVDGKNGGEEGDIAAEVENFRRIKALYHRGNGKEYDDWVLHPLVPRALRKTTREIRRNRALENRRNQAGVAMGISKAVVDGAFLSGREGDIVCDEVRDILRTLRIDRDRDGDTEGNESGEGLVPAERVVVKATVAQDIGNQPPPNGMLSVGDIFSDVEAVEGMELSWSTFSTSSCCVLVDEERGLELLSREIDATVRTIEESRMRRKSRSKGDDDDEDKDENCGDDNDNSEDDILEDEDLFVKTAWGIDCEWRPSHVKGQEFPVATLQLSSRRRAFLVDLQVLCREWAVTDPSVEPNKMERYCSSVLVKLLSDRRIAKLGFVPVQDLSKLAASFPHLDCFRIFKSVLDLPEICRRLHPADDEWRQKTSSLSKVVRLLLGKQISKKEQCSNWQQRPLTSCQINYALLDAAVLPLLLSKLTQLDAWKDHNKRFFQTHPDLITSVRHTYLEQLNRDDSAKTKNTIPPPQAAYRVEKGKAKKILGRLFARQTWITYGKGLSPPRAPIKISPSAPRSSGGGSGDLVSGNGNSGARKRAAQRRRLKKLITLTDLPHQPESLPQAGDIIGYTKDTCIRCLLGSEFESDDKDENSNNDNEDVGLSRLGYNRRGGVVEMATAWLLFVNFGSDVTYAKYQNKFLHGGRQMTFSLQLHKPQECSLLSFFLATNKESMSGEKDHNSIPNKKVFLFLRPSTKSMYMYCGECQYVEKSLQDDSVKLLLQLVEYDSLVKGRNNSNNIEGRNKERGENKCDYLELVSNHGQALMDNGLSAHCF